MLVVLIHDIIFFIVVGMECVQNSNIFIMFSKRKGMVVVKGKSGNIVISPHELSNLV